SMRANIRAVLSHRHTLKWLLCIRLFSLMETPASFEPLWLTDRAGMSETLVGIYVAFEMIVALAGALFLARWSGSISARPLLVVASAGMLLLFPLWFLVPGIWARFAFGA